MNVTIVGASGETGQSIVNGLLRSNAGFRVSAIVRAQSMQKPEIIDLKARGVAIITESLDAPEEELVRALSGTDVVICTVDPLVVAPQIALASAAKKAGVKRFIPSAFASICPPKGVMALREMKEEVINHVKKIHLPYTIIDVGWWYQLTLPRLPSGKIDHVTAFNGGSKLVEDGRFSSSLTDLRDIGRYVARIIVDPRTVNKYVFCYNEVWTQKQIFDLLSDFGGEQPVEEILSIDAIEAAIDESREPYEKGDRTFQGIMKLALAQYSMSVWVRGDNLPEYARYLGYLDCKDLYPDFAWTKYEDYVKEVVNGKGKTVYANRNFS